MTEKEKYRVAVEQLKKLLDEFAKNDCEYVNFGVKILIDNKSYCDFLSKVAWDSYEHYEMWILNETDYRTAKKYYESWRQNVRDYLIKQFLASKGYNLNGKSEVVVNMYIDTYCECQLSLGVLMDMVNCRSNVSFTRFPIQNYEKGMPNNGEFIEFCPYDESQIGDYRDFMEFDKDERVFKLKGESND